MRRVLAVATLPVLVAGAAAGGGIDRSGQPVGIIFKQGSYAELGISHTSPSIGGSDLPQRPPGFPSVFDSGASYDDVADAFTSYSFGIKHDLTDRFSLALFGAEDFGADISYPEVPGSLLGGTEAIADTYALTLMGRYRIDRNWSVHAGLRADRASGIITLDGLAYGGPTIIDPDTGMPIQQGVSGYEVDLDENWAFGYAIGAAYEIPDIALRVAVTYFSPLEHDFGTRETFPVRVGSATGPDISETVDSPDTVVTTPQAVNLDFQTGIAEGTLLFGSVRWAEWSTFEIAPERFENLTGSGLVSLDDSVTYTIGLGRRFTERFSGSASLLYEPESGDALVSPLAPTNGYRGVAIGGSYRIDNIELSGGVRYSWLNEAKPETGTPDVARAEFTDNEAVSVGLRLGVYF